MTIFLGILAGLVVLMAVGAALEWIARWRRRRGLPPRRPDQDRSKQRPSHHGRGL